MPEALAKISSDWPRISMFSFLLTTTTPILLVSSLLIIHEIRMVSMAFDLAPERPENIDTILNGLDRYNPETTSIFQEYVAQQCENQTYDCYANLALLKL